MTGPRLGTYMHSTSVDRASPLDGIIRWPRPTSMSDFKDELMKLLDKDRYCAKCRSARAAPDRDEKVDHLRRYMHCSACGVDHPACLFSMHERRKKTRKCIGHQGFIRLCGHEEGKITWSQSKRRYDAQRRLGLAYDDYGQLRLACPNKSHALMCGTHPGTDVRGDRMVSFLTRWAIVWALRRAHQVISRTARREGGVCPCLWEELYPVPEARPDERIEPLGTLLSISWDAHIDLSGEEQPHTSIAVHRRLSEIRHSGGRFICPSNGPGPGSFPELRCFDPNLCGCIYMEGAREFDWLSKATGGQDNRPRRWDPCEADLQTHSSEVVSVKTEYSFITARPCHWGGRCLAISYRRMWCDEGNLPQGFNGALLIQLTGLRLIRLEGR